MTLAMNNEEIIDFDSPAGGVIDFDAMPVAKQGGVGDVIDFDKDVIDFDSPPGGSTAGASLSAPVSPSPQGVLPLPEATDPGSVAFKERLQAEAMEKAKSEGALVAAGREAAMGVVPSLAGIAGGVAGGALLGSVVPVAGTIGGGIIGGIGAAIGADWLQGKAIEAIDPEAAARLQAEREAAAQVHPVATFAGSLAPQLLTMKPSLKNVAGAFNAAKTLLKGGMTAEYLATPAGKVALDQIFNVGLGAAIPGAQEAYAQYQAGDFNGARVLAQSLAGAIINEPNRFGVKLGLHPTLKEPEIVGTADAAPAAAAPEVVVPDSVQNPPRIAGLLPEARGPAREMPNLETMSDADVVDFARANGMETEGIPIQQLRRSMLTQERPAIDVEPEQPISAKPPTDAANQVPPIREAVSGTQGPETAKQGGAISPSGKKQPELINPERNRYIEPSRKISEMKVRDLRKELDSYGVPTTTRMNVLRLRNMVAQERNIRIEEERRMQRDEAAIARARKPARVMSTEEMRNRSAGQRDRQQGTGMAENLKREAFLEAKIREHMGDDRFIDKGTTVYDASGNELEVVGANRGYHTDQELGSPHLMYDVKNKATGEESVMSGKDLSREPRVAGADDGEVPFQTRENRPAVKGTTIDEHRANTEAMVKPLGGSWRAGKAEGHIGTWSDAKSGLTIEFRHAGIEGPKTGPRAGQEAMGMTQRTGRDKYVVTVDPKNGDITTAPHELAEIIGMAARKGIPEAHGRVVSKALKSVDPDIDLNTSEGAHRFAVAMETQEGRNKVADALRKAAPGAQDGFRSWLNNVIRFVNRLFGSNISEFKDKDFVKLAEGMRDFTALKRLAQADTALYARGHAMQNRANKHDAIFRELTKTWTGGGESVAERTMREREKRPAVFVSRGESHPDGPRKGKPLSAVAMVKINAGDAVADDFQKIVAAWRKVADEATSYASWDDIADAADLPVERVAAAFKNVHKASPGAVAFSVNRMGDNTYAKINKPDAFAFSQASDIPAAWSAWKSAHPDEYAELEKMRADVLKEQGYNVGPVWHGTRQKFNKFKPSSWFATDIRDAEAFGTTRPYYLRLRNVVDNTFGKAAMPVDKAGQFDASKGEPDAVVKYQEKMHHAPVFQVYDVAAIKSAEVTPDDSGRIPPPSEWGDGGNADIRYQTKNPAAESAKAKFAEERKAQAEMFKRKPMTWQRAKNWFGRNWVTSDAPAANEYRKAALKGVAGTEDAVARVDRNFAAVRGASGEAREAMREATNRVFRDNGIKTEKDMDTFNEMAQAKRVIEIDELKRGQAAAERQRLMDLDKANGKTDTHWSQADEAAYQEQLKHEMAKSKITVEEARAYLDEMSKSPDAARFNKAWDEYQKTYKGLLKDARDAGIISDKLFEYLDKNHNNYQPRVFLDKIDPVVESLRGRGGVVEVRQSGIRALKDGSEGDMIMDSPHLLMQKLLMTKTAIAKNKATRSLAELADMVQGQGFDGKVITDLRQPITKGRERIIFRQDGLQKAVEVSQEFAEAWRTSNPQMTQEAMKIMRYASGTAFVKFLATSGNPEFAVANMMRDLGFTFLASKEFSPVLPKAVLQQLRNIGTQAMSRNVRRTLSRYYRNNGGSTDFLSSTSHLEDFHNPGAITQGRRTVNKIVELLGYLGNTSEETVRLAHMQQALRNMGHKDFSESGMANLAKTPEGLEKIRAAVYAASNVLDFRQAGNMSKVVDQFVPFFNPAVQGARGVMRAFKERPAETTFRASQIMALGAWLAWYNRKSNEQAWDSVSDVEKDTKAVITLPLDRVDREGNKRHVYVAPAIDQGWRPFFILGQMIAEKQMGKEVDPKRLKDSIAANYIPYDAANLPPVIAAILTYSQNHDFWRNEKVWRGRDVEPEMERRASTPALATMAGDVTGMSPERLRAAATKLMPDHVIGLAAREAADRITGNKANEEGWLSVSRLPFARKMLRVTSARDLSHDKELAAKRLGVKMEGRANAAVLNEIEKREREVNTVRQRNDVAFDKMVDRLQAGEITKADIYKAAWQVKGEDGNFSGKERLRVLRSLKRKYPNLGFVAPTKRSAED